ncbi:MAG TPA: hypothetical protein VLY23_04385 [Candidatus Acidoferrum sp.]|nr:hypothetical protein [Candidatus Acidoferrum sp.]
MKICTTGIVPKILISFLLLHPLRSSVAQTYPPGYMKDNSDWWSILNEDHGWPKIDPVAKKVTAANLEILGIRLDGLDDDVQFGSVTARLGKATVVERGDASTGRTQICYASPRDSGKVFLIFERGETDFSFYLFTSGPVWNGVSACETSSIVSLGLQTGSRLRLGETRAQVEAILGKPTTVYKNRLIFWDRFPEKARAQSPGLAGKSMASFNVYERSVFIEARFADSKLVYLAVSKNDVD